MAHRYQINGKVQDHATGRTEGGLHTSDSLGLSPNRVKGPGPHRQRSG